VLEVVLYNKVKRSKVKVMIKPSTVKNGAGICIYCSQLSSV